MDRYFNEHLTIYYSLIDEVNLLINLNIFDERLSEELICHYCNMVYVHDELLYTTKLKEKFFILKKMLKNVKRRKFLIKQQLNYALVLFFNDNEFRTGGVVSDLKFAILGDKLVRLPKYYSSKTRRAKIGNYLQNISKKYIYTTDLSYKTMSFEKSDGYYYLPKLFYLIFV